MATQNFSQPVRVLHLLTAYNSGRNPTDPAHKPEHQHEMKIVIHYSLRPHQAQTSPASSASACASASSIAAVSNTPLAAGAPAVADSSPAALSDRVAAAHGDASKSKTVRGFAAGGGESSIDMTGKEVERFRKAVQTFDGSRFILTSVLPLLLGGKAVAALLKLP